MAARQKDSMAPHAGLRKKNSAQKIMKNYFGALDRIYPPRRYRAGSAASRRGTGHDRRLIYPASVSSIYFRVSGNAFRLRVN